VHVVLRLKARVVDRAALTRAALAALERAWGSPTDEDRQALADPARALSELLWASHPTAGPRRAEGLGFEVVESEHETHEPPGSVDRPGRANDEEGKEVDAWHDRPARPSAGSSRRRRASSRRSAGS
jgi:hypothetical protein